jgi:predicted TIM-barrel enzyme
VEIENFLLTFFCKKRGVTVALCVCNEAVLQIVEVDSPLGVSVFENKMVKSLALILCVLNYPLFK